MQDQSPVMFEALVNLPYVHFWLPALAAVVFGLPVYWFARPSRPLVVPVVEGATTTEADPFTTGSTTEQRKAFRRKGNPVEISCAPDGEPAHPERGYVLDR